MAVLILVPLCAGSGTLSLTRVAEAGPADKATVQTRRISPHEVAPPYLDKPEAFWRRADLFVMSPRHKPLGVWPDEVLHPSAHGVRIIVLLAGDYRARKRRGGRAGVLYIADSGTAAEPLLVTYAPKRGADLARSPHPAERFGKSEALLVAVRVWNQKFQYFRGLTFANTVSACYMRETTGSIFDQCLWHETGYLPLRIRFGANHCVVQRCVMRRFDRAKWGHGDTVAISLSDGACTHNHIISNVVLNYTDAYQHTDRPGEAHGLGAGTLIDNNYFGFTKAAHVSGAKGELMCGENAIDMKMGGTAAEPVRITNNVFFGVRAAKKGCAASGSGGYAVTIHRRGTWIVMSHNVFVNVDAGIFLNTFFKDVDRRKGRLDPHLTFTHNLFSGVRSYATAFPQITGRVLCGTTGAVFTHNQLVDCERLLQKEPIPSTGTLEIEQNTIVGRVDASPRSRARLERDANVWKPAGAAVPTAIQIPWVGRTLRYRALPDEAKR